MEKATIYEYARMCKSYDTLGCHYCPLSHCNNGLNQICGDLTRKYPDKANEIILNWCKEHPVETRQYKLLKAFPNVPVGYKTVAICPLGFDKSFADEHKCDNYTDCNICKKDYWLAEVDENE